MPVKKINRLAFANNMELTSTAYLEIRRFILPNVTLNTKSDPIELPLHLGKGKLREVKVECLSNNFDLAIVPWPASKIPSIDVLYSSTEINLMRVARSLDVLFCKGSELNSGVAAALYAIIDNTNGSLDTGEIVLELAYETRI